jgi:hypothetical protein
LELDLVNPPHKEGFLTAVFSWLCVFMFNPTFLKGEQGRKSDLSKAERRAAQGDWIAALKVGQDIVVVLRLGVGAGTETLLLKVAEDMDAHFLKEEDSTAVLRTTQCVNEEDWMVLLTSWHVAVVAVLFGANEIEFLFRTTAAGVLAVLSRAGDLLTVGKVALLIRPADRLAAPPHPRDEDGRVWMVLNGGADVITFLSVPCLSVGATGIALSISIVDSTEGLLLRVGESLTPVLFTEDDSSVTLLLRAEVLLYSSSLIVVDGAIDRRFLARGSIGVWPTVAIDCSAALRPRFFASVFSLIPSSGFLLLVLRPGLSCCIAIPFFLLLAPGWEMAAAGFSSWSFFWIGVVLGKIGSPLARAACLVVREAGSISPSFFRGTLKTIFTFSFFLWGTTIKEFPYPQPTGTDVFCETQGRPYCNFTI